MIRSLHIALAYVTVIGFVLRALLRFAQSPLLQQKWIRIAPHVIEKCLNHVTGGNPATRRYQRYQFDVETMAAWSAWERHLLVLVGEKQADNVVTFAKPPAGA